MDAVRGYIYAGTNTGILYTWHLHTGNLIRSLEAHFKRITAIRVVDDLVLTASEDAVIHVWQTGDLAHGDLDTSVAPCMTFTEHTMSVTGLWAGVATGMEDRFISCSLDRTVKLWDLSTGRCLLTVVAPVPITCAVMDYCETMVLAGGSDGLIYRVNLYPQQPGQDFRQPVGDAVHIGSDDVEPLVFRGHASAITAMEWSIDGSRLYSGSEDGQVHIWDVTTLQLLSTISGMPGPISSLRLMPKPHYLFSKVAPLLAPPQPLQKTFQRKCETIKSVSRVKSQKKVDYFELLGRSTIASSNTSSSKQLEELKAQVKLLQEQNAKLTQVNQEMYNVMLEKYTEERPLH